MNNAGWRADSEMECVIWYQTMNNLTAAASPENHLFSPHEEPEFEQKSW